MSEPDELMLVGALRRHQRYAVGLLSTYGIVDVEQNGDLVTLVYADGYRWTKTQLELMAAAASKRIPRRREALH